MGRVLQVGSPIEIYERPKNEFVASFIGKSTLLRGRLEKRIDGYGVVDVNGLKFKGRLIDEASEGDRVTVVFRPDDCLITEKDSGENIFTGVVETIMFMGSHFHIRLDLKGEKILVKAELKDSYKEGMNLNFHIPPDEIKIISAES